MDLISHVFFGMLLYGRFDIWVVVGAVLPDIDKVYTYPKKIFRGAYSHTFIGELPTGVLIVLMLQLMGFVNPLFFSVGFGYMSHILLDFITGETVPFRPFVKERVNYNWSPKKKIVIGAAFWIAGAALYGDVIWTYAQNLVM